MQEVLSAGYLLEEYRPELIVDILNMLIPDKIRIAIIGKKFEGQTDAKEKWYGTDHKLSNIPEETLNIWNNAGFNKNLILPPINDFIASNLNLISSEEKVSTIPTMIKNTPLSRVWYLKDDKYLKPKAFLGFRLKK
jgi:insulysin